MIPQSICSVLEDQFGLKIVSEKSVSGGSINRAYKLKTNQGTHFLKWNTSVPKNFFEVEAEGLDLLRSANSGLRIPSVIAWQKAESDTPGFLLLEYVTEGSGSSSDALLFGKNLARLHQNKAENFGLYYDNFIGSLPQKNGIYENWTTFFVEKRISPQLKMAIDSGKLSKDLLANWKRLTSKLNEILPPCKPSLLHGDLWGGNYFFDKQGKAVLIDPAVYYGHPEMDLAFTTMFGGFPNAFYEGYESVVRTENGFSERVPVYNMYPLLVHVNLFGGHYASQFVRFIKKY